ncbi:hypothetical protein RhiJN_23535 [Ceratobasidium sp. AG-Ba]|nr:hypothetical protein RhiJN_23535 [Ceratobasidium sp. AG-Ba]
MDDNPTNTGATLRGIAQHYGTNTHTLTRSLSVSDFRNGSNRSTAPSPAADRTGRTLHRPGPYDKNKKRGASPDPESDTESIKSRRIMSRSPSPMIVGGGASPRSGSGHSTPKVNHTTAPPSPTIEMGIVSPPNSVNVNIHESRPSQHPRYEFNNGMLYVLQHLGDRAREKINRHPTEETTFETFADLFSELEGYTESELHDAAIHPNKELFIKWFKLFEDYRKAIDTHAQALYQTAREVSGTFERHWKGVSLEWDSEHPRAYPTPDTLENIHRAIMGNSERMDRLEALIISMQKTNTYESHQAYRPNHFNMMGDMHDSQLDAPNLGYYNSKLDLPDAYMDGASIPDDGFQESGDNFFEEVERVNGGLIPDSHASIHAPSKTQPDQTRNIEAVEQARAAPGNPQTAPARDVPGSGPPKLSYSARKRNARKNRQVAAAVTAALEQAGLKDADETVHKSVAQAVTDALKKAEASTSNPAQPPASTLAASAVPGIGAGAADVDKDATSWATVARKAVPKPTPGPKAAQPPKRQIEEYDRFVFYFFNNPVFRRLGSSKMYMDLKKALSVRQTQAQLVGVEYNVKGSLIVKFMPNLGLDEFRKIEPIIVDVCGLPTGSHANRDRPWGKVIVRRVPTNANPDGSNRFSEKELFEELLTTNPFIATLNITREPRWITSADKMGGEFSSFTFAFESGQDASVQEVCSSIQHMFGKRVIANEWKEKPVLQGCSKCQNLDHTSKFCRQRVRCADCGDNHATEKHRLSCKACKTEKIPIGTKCPHPYKCANCGQAHQAQSAECPKRKAYRVPVTKLLIPQSEPNTEPTRAEVGQEAMMNPEPVPNPIKVVLNPEPSTNPEAASPAVDSEMTPVESQTVITTSQPGDDGIYSQ